MLSLADGPPATATYFNPAPVVEPTYTSFGPPEVIPPHLVPVWMQHFKIFYLPAPWPLWTCWLPKAERPVNLSLWLLGLFGMVLTGAGLICRGSSQSLRQGRDEIVERYQVGITPSL
jgi:hypothetical protein